MNKKDLIPIVVLVLLIPVWMMIDQKYIAPKFPKKQPPAAETQPAPAQEAPGTLPAETDLKAAPAPIAEPVQLPATDEPSVEETLATIENEVLRVEFSSLGGAIRSVTLKAYPELKTADSNPVVLDFSDAYALAYSGLKGIGTDSALRMKPGTSGREIVFTKQWGSAVAFERTVSLEDDYLMKISDRFINQGSDPWTLPSIRILTGRMRNPDNVQKMRGLPTLGVDSYTPAGGINYWGKKLNSLYRGQRMEIDIVPEDMRDVQVDWVSAKNKFFTQILRPEEPTCTISVLSSRDGTGKKSTPVDIAATLNFKPEVVSANSDYAISYSYYVGPKKYSILKDSGYNMEGVMEFETIGFWSFMNIVMEPIRKFLLVTLNKCYSIVPSYGIAIILLTLLMRIVFWPLTHKSTESMKKMQTLQPEIAKLKAKHASNPQKLQQETMLLYKQNKVNPMGGCLPMFVQIPVFIALFTVLRNAIELRYAGFLWISDLSSAENLFAGKIALPGIDSLNILPLLMSATMLWQQKLTPSSGDPNQKMMMYMMPVMMLFFFYKMPSGLVLYWTTSQLMMIAQMQIRNLRQKKKEA
ncbi:MAG: membrane protein insertase YidC [Kiritimatiellales bacterium]|nr:membrane protein insertase YidC [Kiritimatiellales bacterium]